MPSVEVVDLNNAVVGSLELADEVFAAPVNEDLLYEAVRHSQAGSPRRKRQDQDAARSFRLRQETVAAKGNRPRAHGIHPLAAVAARWDSARSAARDYSYKLPRKMLLGALRSALSAKLRDGELRVVRAFSLEDHKTKAMRAVLTVLGAPKTVLLVDNGENQNLALSSRNLAGVKLVSSKDVSVYDLLGHAGVLLSENAAKKLSEALAK